MDNNDYMEVNRLNNEDEDREGLVDLTDSTEPRNIKCNIDEKPIFFDDALKILGWQGGTIHQVLEVLRIARSVASQFEESHFTGEWELMSVRLQQLASVIKG